jgi:hypothetical protein
MDWTLEATAPTGRVADALRGAREGLHEEDPETGAADDQIAAAIRAAEALVLDPSTGPERWYGVTISGVVNDDADGNEVTVTVAQAESPESGLVETDPEAPPVPAEEFLPHPSTGTGVEPEPLPAEGENGTDFDDMTVAELKDYLDDRRWSIL